MAVQVNIAKGFYRGELVSGIFPLRQEYKDGKRGGFITIWNEHFKPGTGPLQRVMVEKSDFTIIDETGDTVPNTALLNITEGKITHITNYEADFLSNESDEDAMNRIEETFNMLNVIVDSCARGIVRGLVVYGPPGIGKSFGVEEQLKAVNCFRVVNNQQPLYEVVSGSVSSIGLYQILYRNRKPNQVLVFDDADGILFEEESLNLIKGALNSGDKRRICWNKESRVLATEDIPESFDFEGSIVFLSNIDFEKTIAKGSRIGQHLAAIVSRCHYLDMEIGSMRDKLLRIKQIVRDGMLDAYDFSDEEVNNILAFVVENQEYLREVSLRMVKKIADLVKASPRTWVTMAEATVLTREAKFKRLVKHKELVAA